ncbi:hypothetical protein [Nocardia asteroides]|uniref:hypothetical protein n=1 Tax=Nocardia asteroides TaxID=1824 RepID=UPI0034358270
MLGRTEEVRRSLTERSTLAAAQQVVTVRDIDPELSRSNHCLDHVAMISVSRPKESPTCGPISYNVSASVMMRWWISANVTVLTSSISASWSGLRNGSRRVAARQIEIPSVQRPGLSHRGHRERTPTPEGKQTTSIRSHRTPV